MKKHILIIGLILVLAIPLLIDVVKDHPGVYQITQDTRVQAGPGDSYEKIGMLQKEMQVTVWHVTKSRWGEITYHDQKGYISLKDARIHPYTKGYYLLREETEYKDGAEASSKTLGTFDPDTYVLVEKVKNTSWGQTTYCGEKVYLSLEYAVKDSAITSYHKIPTYNQETVGWLTGCEGVSAYMALRGLGYLQDVSIDDWMETMPLGATPYEGFMGDPHYYKGDRINAGCRTTIYPPAVAKWINEQTGKTLAKDLTGAFLDDLKAELDQGHICMIYVTTRWLTPEWKLYDFSHTDQGEVENNHCLTLVGYDQNGNFLINDCTAKIRTGEYWTVGSGRSYSRGTETYVTTEDFEKIYNARKFAVAIG
ncbi:MAG: C39 family peptidase [bacterium]